MADGTVKFLDRNRTSEQSLRSLVTRDGGEVVFDVP
jgi:hypothetical protein